MTWSNIIHPVERAFGMKKATEMVLRVAAAHPRLQEKRVLYSLVQGNQIIMIAIKIIYLHESILTSYFLFCRNKLTC